MAWTYNNKRIYVQKIGGGGKQIIPRLQPLSGGTVFQLFGYETTIVKVSAIVVGDTILANLLSYKADETAHAFVSPEGALGNYYVGDIKYDRLPISYQTITTDCEAPVYMVDLELIPG